jgi:membrane protein
LALALLTVGVGAVLLFAALVSISGLAILGNAIPDEVPGVARLLNIVFWSVLTLGPALTLVLVYRYGPARSAILWRWALPGTVIASIAWLVSTLAFQLYVTSIARYQSIYGSLSAIVVLQLWLMISAYILLFGAKVNAEAMRQSSAGSGG